MLNRRVQKSRASGGLIEAINQNNSLIFIAVCSILGLLAGTLIFSAEGNGAEKYSQEFNKIYKELCGGFISAFWGSMLRLAPYAVIIFLAGGSMAGAVLVPCLIAIRGYEYGIILAYTCKSFGLLGIIFNLLMLIPSGVISTLALMLSGREAMGFSLSLARLVLPSSITPDLSRDFRVFCLRELFMLIFFVAAALLEAVMGSAFADFFKF